MGLIDSHAHLTFPELRDQVDAVLDRCADAGVERVISIGTNLADARGAIELANRYPAQVYAGVGFHPHEAGKVTDTDFAAMADLWSDAAVVAIGEMGLDYHYDFADREAQRRVFGRQLELARPFEQPIVIHAREAFEDVEQMLVDHGFTNRKVVFHCFTGTASEADRLAEHGWRISFTGIVTFPKSGELQAIAKDYPIDKLMIETDSPYLSPVPVRGKRPNEPAHVAHVARFLSDLRGTEFDTFAEQTAAATRSFFDLSRSEA